MKTEFKKIFPMAVLAILLISASPIASASTLTVNLNPKTGLAKLDSVSTTKITFTYPSNSTVSMYLRNVSSSLSLSGKFDGSTPGTIELQGSFDDWDNHIRVSNVSVAVDFSAKGSATSLVVEKTTDVNATVSGAFNVINGTVTADLGWRAFVVRGAMDFPLEGHDVDVNLAGSAMEDSIGSHDHSSGWLMGAFSSGAFWNRPTLNFSALNTPLSIWTKNYNAATNTTTFSKTISAQDTFSVNATYNGQKYTFSAVSDPSGVVTVQGYANASGDSLVIASSPATASSSIIAASVVIGLLILAGGYLAIRVRTRPKVTAAGSTALPV